MRRVLASALASFLVLAASQRAAAEDTPPPVQRAADLDDAALLSRAASAAARLADAEKAFESEQKALAAAQDQLRADEARASARTPEAAPRAPDGAAPLAAAKAAQDAAAARLDAAKARLRLVEEENALLDDCGKRFESARVALTAVSSALDDAELLAAELEARIGTKRIAAAKIPPALATRTIKDRRGSLAAAEASRQRDVASAQKTAASLAARIAAARDDVKGREKELQAATRAVDEQKRRDAIEKELGDRDAPSLGALLSTLAVDRDRLAQALEPARAAFEKARESAAAAEADLARETAPDPEKVKVDAAPARVMAAQRTLELVRAVVDYQERRSERLAAVEASLAALDEKAATTAASASELDAVLLRMSVLSSLLEKKRGDPPNTSVADERRRSSAVADAASEATAFARRRRPALEKEIAESRAAEKAQREKLAPLVSALDQARANARWTQEVEQLPTPEVVRRFVDARDRARAADAAVASARRRFGDAEAAVVSGSLSVESFDEPLSRKAREENPDERRRILVELARTAGQEPPAETGAGASAKMQDLLAMPAMAPGAATAKGSEALALEIEAREATLANRVRAFEDEGARLAAFLVLVGEARDAAAALEKALAEQSSIAQRTHGSALELETRAGLGQMPAGQLPAGVSEAASYDRLAAIEAETAATEAARASLAARAIRLEGRGSDAEKGRALLRQAISIRGKMVELLRVRGAREAAFDRAEGSLGDTEKRRREQESLRRLESEDSAREAFLSIFTNDRAAVLTDLLRSYYGELLDLEGRLSNLDERSRLTTELLAAEEEERRNFAERLPVARRRLVQVRADEAAARIRAGLTSPRDAAALAALSADGQTAPTVERVDGDLVALADRIFFARARVIAGEALVRQIEQGLAPGGLDLEKGAREDELAELATRSDTTKREAQRATSEVEKTRSLRGRVLESAATHAIERFLLIPFIAFVVIRAMHSLGTRIVKRARGEGARASPDREHRAQTIVHVFTRAWAGVVVTVAAIYMLKELKIDVTPILASAGVVGLAIAFGAQALIRDYLGGFFILLENQYQMGDTVKIGDSTGIVERITLRLTVLRALDGTVFYIPNGSVQLVANLTRDWARATLKIAVGYDADIERATAVLKEVGKAMDGDPILGGKILEPPEMLGIEDFGDKGIVLSVLFRTLPNEQPEVLREARIRIKKAFDRERVPLALPEEPSHHVYPPESSPPGPPAPA